MIEISHVREAFPELSGITHLGINSGQKIAFSALAGTRPVCLKLIKRASVDLDPRTEREVQAVQRLNSEYVPKIIDVGRREVAGVTIHYIIEDFVHGETYLTKLQSTPVQPLKSVLSLAHALLTAANDFTAATLVHRDIKPGNLIIGPDGKTWVIDFGLVRLLDLESLTRTDLNFGVYTPGYAAPEQIRNKKPEIDIRADLYSIGMVIDESLRGFNFHMTNKRSFLEVLASIERTDPPNLVLPADSAGKVADFVASLCSRFPSRRPQTSQEALTWLESIRPTT